MTPPIIEFPTEADELQTVNSWQSPHGHPLPEVGRRTLIMGVLNVTPDSFSDGRPSETLDAIVARAAEMVHSGADLLDIGGESTRPSATPVDEAEELSRVLPVIRALRQAWPTLPLSVDTYKARVAEAAIDAGADIVNDVWGLTHGFAPETRLRFYVVDPIDPLVPIPSSPMAAVIARLGCPIILMHNRPNRDYRDFWGEMLGDFRLSLALARRAGIADHQIWLDPGFGFAKDVPHNLEIIKHLERIVRLGYPVLVGTSRKSTLGKVLNRTVDHRLEGTAASIVWAIQQGCRMVRVHDVAAVKPFVQMADAIKVGLDFVDHG